MWSRVGQISFCFNEKLFMPEDKYDEILFYDMNFTFCWSLYALNEIGK